ncbi:MAG: carbamoyl-phosphate synthase large subunit, partial [Candidatus Omnitrophota bacterium]
DLPRSGVAHTVEEALAVSKEINYPLAIRPSFTLGGSGGGFAYCDEDLIRIVANGLSLSMTKEVLVEESLVGWKEFEMEVMRDKKDNVVIICSIENIDAMGVHTGDSITVAPQQTLTDKEYQHMRDASIACIREIGVETGGSNVQFAINPKDGRMVVIEMNPRVSRSSALASKATGFPIAKIAAKLAIGYTLDELTNDITQKTAACFEPSIDYCVVKIPRFTFEKFPDALTELTTQMKSVGETMSIGRTFKESMQKALRGLETGLNGFEVIKNDSIPLDERLSKPNAERMAFIKKAMEEGYSLEKIHALTLIDPWFLDNLLQIHETELELKAMASSHIALSQETLLQAKQFGFSDVQLARIFSVTEIEFRKIRIDLGVTPTYQLVDTCAAEFEAFTPYYYSTYETQSEYKHSDKPKIIILGGGPNRIGQGIEFDYCCCHAAYALKEIGYETIIVNSNPETVSTDYDTSDRLYFEPLTFEDVMNIIDVEKPTGVIVQYGGQTPLNLAPRLHAAGVPIIGTPTAAIERAEDRAQFKAMLDKLGLKQPPSDTAFDVEGIKLIANKIKYPVLLRPSFVLGGRAMEIVYDDKSVEEYMVRSADLISPDRPVLVDHFLQDAIEVDVDMIADGEMAVVGGVMQHIEEAGVHSGDSACCIPPHSLSESIVSQIKEQAKALAKELGVIGLMNIQFAAQGENIFILEVNPRASRTVPFVSKAIGVPLAKIGAKVMAGKKLAELGFTQQVEPKFFSVKEAVLPFVKFRGVDIILGPEMKSTGEVMGVDRSFSRAYVKAQIAAGTVLPKKGIIFLSVKELDRPVIVEIARDLDAMGFEIVATQGTAKVLSDNNIYSKSLRKLSEGSPNILDLINRGAVDLVINTASGSKPRKDEVIIRSTATSQGVPCITTMAGAKASVSAIQTLIKEELHVRAMQQYHSEDAVVIK